MIDSDPKAMKGSRTRWKQNPDATGTTKVESTKYFFVARHSESEEQVVVYRTLYGDHSYWVRPLDMFLESVEVDGALRPRFERIAD